MQQPTSLIAKVLKAKYYPKQSLLTSACKANSSYAWKSIFQGIKLISTGLKYIVGNGKQINVWQDPWLHLNPPRPARGPGASTNPNLKVSDLLLHGHWNEPLLNNIIHHEDIPHIKNIRPSITGADDVLTWIHTKDGLYSVKSGYHVQRKLSHNTIQDKPFARLWKQNMPQKIKHFWWRCLHNVVPTAENLKKRRMLKDDTCQRCGEAPETINHLLFQCRISKEIWDLTANFNGIRSPFYLNSVDQNIELLLNLNNNQRKDASLFPFIGWRIWKMRNDLIFNNKRWSLPDTINKAILDFQQWKESYSINKHDSQKYTVPEHHKHQSSATNTSISSITKEAKGYCCFVDASWNSPNDSTGIGWALYNKNAQIVLKGMVSINPMSTPLEVEAEALRMAVLHTNRLGYTNVVFFGDAESLYQQTSRIFSGNHRCHQADHTILATLLKDIENIARSYETINFVKIPRFLNGVADGLAKQARINRSSFVISWNHVN
ncbi:PREDICTED: uncharacterized protein LOC104716077 [Camelina sativa]|uniref:Uncharacterized protein LOC104716077 n=1 Tax=Camelina sativa TaxID=90675 RepID=A0ABM0TUM2_CAMSA|nr:PREDICTED: uncharacterized protein LOC104716077 [Camelina sativa]